MHILHDYTKLLDYLLKKTVYVNDMSEGCFSIQDLLDASNFNKEISDSIFIIYSLNSDYIR